jgi:hypothetical protein
MKMIKVILSYLVILSLILLACTQIKINKEYFSHLKQSNTTYENAKNSVYPNQNFIFLQRLISVEDKNGEKDFLPLTSASGVVVKGKKNKVYAFSAGHWCKSSTEEVSAINLLSTLNPGVTIKIANNVSFFGRTYPIKIIHIDEKNDICVLTFESEYAHKVKKIKPAKRYPKIGEKVYTSSAPVGMYNHDMRLHFEGRFAGCESNSSYCFYSIPGTMGSSGSGILDRNGDLISILDVSIVDFHHITGGTRLEIIKELYEKFIE